MSSRTGCTCCKAAASSSRAARASPWSSSGAVTASSKTRPEETGTTPMSAVVDFPVKPETRAYLEAFGRHHRKGDPDWLAGYRDRSLARFAELGFPSRRSEAWRYLDLRSLEQRPMLPVEPEGTAVTSTARDQLAEIGLVEPAYRLVLVNGRFSPELSRLDQLPSAVWLGPMEAAIALRPDPILPGFEEAAVDRAIAC